MWPLLEVVEARSTSRGSRSAPAAATRARAGSRRVRHLAELFDRYALHRPEMVRGWAEGGRHWQAELWRRLRDADRRARARRSGCDAACERLRAEPDLVDLPAAAVRCSASRACPPASSTVLRALAAHRDVHLFLLHPSPALWEQVAAQAPAWSRAREDPTARLPRNRLLASWGQDARELQLVLGRTATSTEHHPVEHRDGHAARPPAGRRPRRPRRRRPGSSHDRSDRRSTPATAAPARSRSLRDAILHLLADDPTLEPRDVIVMCPDIETFAPLIQATFGAGEIAEDEDETRRLAAATAAGPARAARRPLAAPDQPGARRRRAAARARRRAADRLAGARPRRPRAGPPALPARRRRPRAAGGLGRARAASAGASTPSTARRSSSTTLADGHLARGLDRCCVGVTMTEDDQRLFGGRAAARRRRQRRDRPRRAPRRAASTACSAALDALREPQTVAGWAAALADAADALTRRARATPGSAPSCSGCSTTSARGRRATTRALEPAEVRALLADRLAGRPTRANFRTGHLTSARSCRCARCRTASSACSASTTAPSRARRPRDGDDLMLDDPHVGDRDPRTRGPPAAARRAAGRAATG